ncbi:MAG: hypothetical protein AAF215_28920 [Cyanobacteria bacterium P01_A01_bin.123]
MTDRPDPNIDKSAKVYEIIGWLLFIVSAVFFTGSTIQAGDRLGILGSLFFLIACFIFLIPLLRA